VTPFLAGLVVGGILGGTVMHRNGRTVARALRAYRDWRGTRDSIRGLRRRTVAMWFKAAKQWAVALAALAGVLWLLYSAGSR
jgi:hypothetical protein